MRRAVLVWKKSPRAGLFALALLVRLLYLWDIRENPFFSDPVLDLYTYDQWAQEIAAGNWLGHRVFYQSPPYPYFLGVIYWLVGRRLWFVYLVQAVLGSLDCLLIYGIGRRLFDRKVGLIAGFAAALYKGFLFYDGLLLKTFLEVLLLDFSLWLLLVTREKQQRRFALLAGIALGMGALARDNFLLLAPFLACWLAAAAAPAAPRLRLSLAAAFLAGAALIVALTAYRNFRVGQDLVLITAQGGQNFYLGNHNQNYWGVYKAPPFVRANPLFEESDFRAEAERRTGRKDWKPSQLSNFWFAQAWQEIQARPGLFGLRLARKAFLFFTRQEISDNISYSFFARNYSWLLRLPLPGWGLIVPLGLLGMGLALASRKGRLLALVFGVYFSSIILFFIFTRYRIQMAPVLLIFSAFAVGEGIRRWQARRFRELAVGIGVGAGLTVLTSFSPLHEQFDNVYFTLGNHLAREGRYAEAVAMYEKAAQMMPRHYHYQLALGFTYLDLHNPDMAILHLRRAVELEPKLPEGHLYLGAAYLQKDLLPEALFELRQVLLLDEANVSARVYLGRLYERVDRPEQALEYYQQALELDPANQSAQEGKKRLLSGK